MKQKKMLTLTLSQLKQLYQQELPELYQLANETTNETDFKNNLDKFLSLHPQAESNTGKQIRLLINYDGRSINRTRHVGSNLFITPPIPYRKSGKHRHGHRFIHRPVLPVQKT